MGSIYRLIAIALGFGITFAIGGCSPVQFEANLDAPIAALSQSSPQPAPPPREQCAPTGASSRLTKILFLVDGSGSNNTWFTPAVGNALECRDVNRIGCAPPTDPTKAFRVGSIQRYFDRYRAVSNFEWSFIAFAGSSSTGLMPSGSTGSAFTPNPNVMQAAIQAFLARPDAGGTPVSTSLQMAAATVLADPDRGSLRDPQYVVVLLTDGYPSDYASANDALIDVDYLRAAAPGAVTLSTIYYGSQDSTSAAALSFLGQIASAGGGQFANVNDPRSGIDIQTVIPGQSCQ